MSAVAAEQSNSVIQGTGEYRYAISNDWAKVPAGMEWREVGSVTVDDKDRVYVFNRGPHPVMVFDREGNFLKSWGEGLFKNAHGAQFAPDGTLFLTDDFDHTVRQCTVDGEVLMTLGVADRPSAFMSGEPFNRCTHTAHAPNGDFYVTDGYHNARVHKYTPDGKHILSWGGPGTEPGQFNIPHNITCDADGWVYVADRESHRIQVFDGNGKYETQWNNLHRPSGMYMPPGKCPICYVGEGGPVMPVNRAWPNLGPRVSIIDNTGKLLARFGMYDGAGNQPGAFISPHGIAVDSHGDIYIGEVSDTAWKQLRPGTPPPQPLNSLRKMTKLPA
jgi:DNA-binding beta-propeller fold protein YncE